VKLSPGRIALGAVGLGAGVVGVLALREATLSTHEQVVGQEMEVVVSADTKGAEGGQTLAEMVEAQLLTCRLEVTSDFVASELVGPIEPLGDDRFRAVLTPALDDTNRRQFRGCVEDFMIDHVQINVVELTDLS
jgi:uncharacterized protein (UPF0261 family)